MTSIIKLSKLEQELIELGVTRDEMMEASGLPKTKLKRLLEGMLINEKAVKGLETLLKNKTK